MTNPNRVQRGVPTGGRFAPATHDESDVELTDAAVPGISGPGAGWERALAQGAWQRADAARVAAAPPQRPGLVQRLRQRLRPGSSDDI